MQIKIINKNIFIDKKLEQRQIKRLDNYINNSTKIRFKCLLDNCQHIWKTIPQALISPRIRLINIV